MHFFKGKNKTISTEIRLDENIRISKNNLTKIPKHITKIEKYPSILKAGKTAISEDSIESTFKEFLGENKELFKVIPENLKLLSSKKINNKWYIKYAQYYKDIPVYNGTVGLDSSDKGKVGSYAANYYPDINISTDPKIEQTDAIGIAIKLYDELKQNNLKSKDESLIIYPENIQDKIVYHLAWKIMVVGKKLDPEVEKYFIIDAMDGKILKSYSARFPAAVVSGTVEGEIYPENPTDSISTVALKNVYVDIKNAGRTTTNDTGRYFKTVGWFWELTNWPFGESTFTLEGPYAKVEDDGAVEYNETNRFRIDEANDYTWTGTDRDHINLFYHINKFHDWFKDELGYSWTNPWTGTSQFNAQVNDPRNNAWAGDPMLFGTNNFARSSDVIYHECTHNILFEIYGDWIGFPDRNIEAYALDEGFADYFGSSCTNESRHGEGYSASPRNLNNTRQYPGKNSYSIEGHTGGMIISGAVWDFRQRLVNIYGVRGARIADQLILEAHQILSTYPRGYHFSDPHESNFLSALYKAADVDNNLLNGFPHFNDIQHAFHAHSLLQAILEDGDSYDFSTNTVGNFTGGDLYYFDGKFWANNSNQKGVIDLGNIGDTDLAVVEIPNSGYSRSEINAVIGHTYVSRAQEGEEGSYIVFRINDISTDKSNVTIQYFYRYQSSWYVANLNSKEIHKLDCNWVARMANGNKSYCKSLEEVTSLIKDHQYNGCHYCLPRYDTDTLNISKVLDNLNEDLQ